MFNRNPLSSTRDHAFQRRIGNASISLTRPENVTICGKEFEACFRRSVSWAADFFAALRSFTLNEQMLMGWDSCQVEERTTGYFRVAVMSTSIHPQTLKALRTTGNTQGMKDEEYVPEYFGQL